MLDLTSIDQVTLSPSGGSVAIVLQRPARPGEVFGRTAYEVDPSRADVWLVSLATLERRNLTQGAESAAGYWCATWSPDGTKIAMLSTQPEGAEPRGGDNVRLYLWNRSTSAVVRLSERPVMTQTRYGSPLHRLDLRGGPAGDAVHRCSNEENAPFMWLDNHRLLVVMLPEGEVSGLIDEASRPFRHAERTARALAEGREPTVTAVASGAARMPEAERTSQAELWVVDSRTNGGERLATLPIYPFRGELTVDVAPDRRRAAILATLGTIPPEPGARPMMRYESWMAEKRLGFVTLAPGEGVQWITMPADAPYPLELFGWSPDSRRVALRARASYGTGITPLYVASDLDRSIQRIGPEGLWVDDASAGSVDLREFPTFWADEGRLLARLGDGDRADWWLLSLEGKYEKITSQWVEPLPALRRSGTGGFFALSNGRLVTLDLTRRTFVASSDPLPEGAALAWPRHPQSASPVILLKGNESEEGRVHSLVMLDRAAPSERRFMLPPSAEPVAIGPKRDLVLWTRASRRGLHLGATVLDDGRHRDLLCANHHLASVRWGETRLVEYEGSGGQLRKAGIILPPGYLPDRRYPVITWIYPGFEVRNLDTYFLHPHLPGIYNLQLYAAQGYVVLIPSIPRTSTAPDGLPDYTGDVLPAVDRLVDMGIADERRIGVMGQSFGGFGVYALVTQTNRFRAAAAIAGITDFTTHYNEFDRAARDYPGIEHEKSINWEITEQVAPGFGISSFEDPDLYARASPLRYVTQVQTPMLLIHGEHDKRGPMTQAESFFYSLYRQGKTARLLRYWGESHALAQSPANIRNIYEEILAWFATYLGPDGDMPIEP
ncbi:prolyl oligopeptidase family serine peptidase [Sphingosinicella sp. CPCC 101087]|uniref:prolyl oligopeptidase family serine peptidase n=1 Tax=Sphingosinicella sp. CPCC 101087 TaxID=2497754 RepID=UPI0013ED8C96|nr:prolyl oligopeptidase family serine peptidase [Sphingosinicella sp. CPCC 101087]